MISTGEMKKGVSVEIDGSLFQIIEVQHVKTKKSAVYRVKLKDLRAGHITERTFNAGEKLTAARVERRDMQYLYGDADALTFMNTQTFDQINVPRGIAGNALISGIARQPEGQGRLFTPFFITVGLVEAAYFINLAFMALFVFATPGAS